MAMRLLREFSQRCLMLGIIIITISGVAESASFKSIGCYRDSQRNPRPLPKLKANLRPMINKQWSNLDQVIQVCASLVEKEEMKFFGVEFYGECWGSKDGVGHDKDGESSRCTHGVGKANAIHIYEITNNVPPQPPRCGIKRTSRIIGGDTAVHNDWPWQAEILMHSEKDKAFLHRCGGTLIHPEWIVTAAHCIFNSIDPTIYRIKLGEHDRTKQEPGELEFGVSVIHIHDRFFTGAYWYDIALMKLDRPAMLSHAVSPACLPTQYKPIEPGTNCFMTGWGMTVLNGPPANTLQQARMPIVSDEECNRVNSALRTVDSYSMICAGYGGNSSISGCRGDSGGPLVCQEEGGRWFLRGVVSWGDHRCSGSYYSVFARVSSFVDWIHCKMNSKPLAKPVGCVDAHFYCKNWKMYCESPYFAYMLQNYYCKKTCNACMHVKLN